MKIHDFKKGMDKAFGDRHINIGGIPTPPIHTIGLVCANYLPIINYGLRNL